MFFVKNNGDAVLLDDVVTAVVVQSQGSHVKFDLFRGDSGWRVALPTRGFVPVHHDVRPNVDIPVPVLHRLRLR